MSPVRLPPASRQRRCCSWSLATTRQRRRTSLLLPLRVHLSRKNSSCFQAAITTSTSLNARPRSPPPSIGFVPISENLSLFQTRTAHDNDQHSIKAAPMGTIHQETCQ